jgi:hypothetical protein
VSTAERIFRLAGSHPLLLLPLLLAALAIGVGAALLFNNILAIVSVLIQKLIKR